MPKLKPAARVAVIGAGPSGAIAVDALAQENVFATIRVFERREGPGGCWYVSSSLSLSLSPFLSLPAKGERDIKRKKIK